MNNTVCPLEGNTTSFAKLLGCIEGKGGGFDVHAFTKLLCACMANMFLVTEKMVLVG